MTPSLTTAETPPIKPLPLALALLYFGGSALLFRACVYGLMPYLLHRGVSLFGAFISSYSLALTALIGATLVALRQDGYALNWLTFHERLRFRPLTLKAWAGRWGYF